MAPPSKALIRDLRRVVGTSYVLHRPEELLTYEYDAAVERASPEVVVLPASTDEAAQVVAIAYEHDLPVVPRGAGTGLSGGAIPSQGGLLLPLTRMRRIHEIDPQGQTALVDAGVVNLDVSRAAAPHGLRYAPDPSSQKACTIGGNVAENAGGPHCLAYGVTTNHVLGLEGVLSDGTVVWLGGSAREYPGYYLRWVVVGSEGTLVVVTRAQLRLMPLPETTRTLLAPFPSMDQAGAAVSRIIAAGIVPAALEMMDQMALQAVEAALQAGYPQDAGAVLLVEVEGLAEAVEEETADVEALCRECGATEVWTAHDPAARDRLWAGRKAALGALGRLAPSYYLLDGVVPRSRIQEALQGVQRASKEYGLPIANVLHAGDGNLHPCILFDERAPGELQRAMKAGGEILRLCVELGGALSGEHGVGIEKSAYMPLFFGPADLEAMARLRPAFRSKRFNPGKVFPNGASCVEMPQGSAIARAGPEAFV
jgi:glycolate oxidase